MVALKKHDAENQNHGERQVYLTLNFIFYGTEKNESGSISDQ